MFQCIIYLYIVCFIFIKECMYPNHTHMHVHICALIPPTYTQESGCTVCVTLEAINHEQKAQHKPKVVTHQVHRTDQVDQECQHHAGKGQGYHQGTCTRHWSLLPAASPPSLATASYASGTSPAGYVLPTPRQTPVEFKKCLSSALACSLTTPSLVRVVLWSNSLCLSSIHWGWAVLGSDLISDYFL